MDLDALRFAVLLGAIVLVLFACGDALIADGRASESSPARRRRGRRWFRPADVGMWAIAMIALIAAADSRAQESSANPPIDCVPAQGPFAAMPADQAQGRGVVSKANGWGEALGWWCPSADGTTWIRNSWVIMHSTRFNMGNMSPRLKAVMTHASPLAAAQRMALQYAVVPSGVEKVQSELLHAAVRKMLENTRPDDPVWVTAPERDNGARKQARSAFVIKADGTRDASRPVPLRAKPGRTCSCGSFAIRTETPGLLWCSWQDAPPHIVTACQRKGDEVQRQVAARSSDTTAAPSLFR